MSFAIKMLHEDIDGTVTLEMITYDGTNVYVSFDKDLLEKQMSFAAALDVIYGELKRGAMILQRGVNYEALHANQRTQS